MKEAHFSIVSMLTELYHLGGKRSKATMVPLKTCRFLLLIPNSELMSHEGVIQRLGTLGEVLGVSDRPYIQSPMGEVREINLMIRIQGQQGRFLERRIGEFPEPHSSRNNAPVAPGANKEWKRHAAKEFGDAASAAGLCERGTPCFFVDPNDFGGDFHDPEEARALFVGQCVAWAENQEIQGAVKAAKGNEKAPAPSKEG